LFGWRREARQRFEASADAPPFVPAVVEATDGERASLQGAPSERATARLHSIELDIDGTSVWIWRDANAAMVTAIIGALKAAK
jgi:transposase